MSQIILCAYGEDAYESVVRFRSDQSNILDVNVWQYGVESKYSLRWLASFQSAETRQASVLGFQELNQTAALSAKINCIVFKRRPNDNRN